MKVFERVTGSEAQAKPLIVGKTTVYVHEDITPVTQPDPITGEVPKGMYTYKEIQYEKDEYIKLMADKNAVLEKQATDIQMALTEVYEMML